MFSENIILIDNFCLGLVSLSNNISTFMGYFMPKSCLYKNNSDTILPPAIGK